MISPEIKRLLDDEVQTDKEVEYDHEQGCHDCNGHDITNWHEYQEQNGASLDMREP